MHMAHALSIVPYTHKSPPGPTQRAPHNLRKLGRHRNITVRDVLDEVGIRIVQHDVEVLDGMHALQTLPVLEPRVLVGLQPRAERLLHVGINLLERFGRRIARLRVIGELELGPDDEVDDLGVDSVWPVVVEDLDVLYVELEC